MELPKIYPITDVSITKLSHLEQVKQLIHGGARFIQLREKYSSPKEFYEAAKAVMDFVRNTNVKIIINDRVDIALAVKADGVHLGQDDLPPIYAREILGKEAIIGFSTHSVAQAVEAVKFPINYAAIGPIFDTTTKENPDATIGIEGLKTVRQAIGDFPLVAIGGIDFENFSSVLENGADSAAIISAILKPSHRISENFGIFVKQL
ncbi:MAG: thiamine phosphate synthase [Pyrinomonadaceae bacterium]|nr:thiamine phosphate synthase [Pyrinomonadaceae bacterium]